MVDKLSIEWDSCPFKDLDSQHSRNHTLADIDWHIKIRWLAYQLCNLTYLSNLKHGLSDFDQTAQTTLLLQMCDFMKWENPNLGAFLSLFFSRTKPPKFKSHYCLKIPIYKLLIIGAYTTVNIKNYILGVKATPNESIMINW